MIEIKKSASEICSSQCCGVDNYSGSCCSLENRDWIIGPIHDSQQFIDKLSEKFGRKIPYSDVFIEFEEGKNLFPERSNWQNPSAYPALRVDTESAKKPCIFYNKVARACSVYDIRPVTCRLFKCDYLRLNS